MKLIDLIFTTKAKSVFHAKTYSFYKLRVYADKVKNQETDMKFIGDMYKNMHLSFLATLDQYVNRGKPNKETLEKQSKMQDSEINENNEDIENDGNSEANNNQNSNIFHNESNNEDTVPSSRANKSTLQQDYVRNKYSQNWYEYTSTSVETSEKTMMSSICAKTKNNDSSFEQGKMKLFNPKFSFAKQIVKKTFYSTEESSTIILNDSSLGAINNQQGKSFNLSNNDETMEK